jgi:hypothetical protein
MALVSRTLLHFQLDVRGWLWRSVRLLFFY